MLAMILSFPPHRAQPSISTPNTRLSRRAQFIATYDLTGNVQTRTVTDLGSVPTLSRTWTYVTLSELLQVLIGTKMLLIDVYKIPVVWSLGVTAGILASTVVLSLMMPPKDKAPRGAYPFSSKQKSTESAD